MQVTAWKNIDVEVEVDVDLDAVLSEFFARAEEADGEYWRRIVPALDRATRFLAAVKAETIAALPEAARVELYKRLAAELARYAPDDANVR